VFNAWWDWDYEGPQERRHIGLCGRSNCGPDCGVCA
jgi:hypothetical protein